MPSAAEAAHAVASPPDRAEDPAARLDEARRRLRSSIAPPEDDDAE